MSQAVIGITTGFASLFFSADVSCYILQLLVPLIFDVFLFEKEIDSFDCDLNEKHRSDTSIDLFTDISAYYLFCTTYRQLKSGLLCCDELMCMDRAQTDSGTDMYCMCRQVSSRTFFYRQMEFRKERRRDSRQRRSQLTLFARDLDHFKSGANSWTEKADSNAVSSMASLMQSKSIFVFLLNIFSVRTRKMISFQMVFLSFMDCHILFDYCVIPNISSVGLSQTINDLFSGLHIVD